MKAPGFPEYSIGDAGVTDAVVEVWCRGNIAAVREGDSQSDYGRGHAPHFVEDNDAGTGETRAH